MAEPAIRTVLLAREGAARDRLVEALVEAGAEVVQTVDPTQSSPDDVATLGAHAVVVALEPALEEALDAYEPVLADPARTVIFEEAALVLERTGWDAARWVRHLGAKLHGRRSVLPPGAETTEAETPPSVADGIASGDGAVVLHDPGPIATGNEDAAAAPTDPMPWSTDLAADEPPAGDGDGDGAAGAHAFDPVNAEFDGLDAAGAQAPTEIVPVELESGALPPQDTAPVDAGTGYAFDPVAAEFDGADAGGPVEVPAIDLDFDFEPVDTGDLGSAVADGASAGDSHGDAIAVPAWQLDVVDEASDDVASGDGAGAPTGTADTPDSGASVLSDGDTLALADTDAAPLRDSVSSPADPPQNAPRAVDLSALEDRISGLSLVDADSYGHGPVRGLVLVEGGLGGPDAVRQLLGAIPEGFPRPILIRLQLDGGRYDRLVRQMERATPLPVQLAEAGMSVVPGEVYFLAPGLLPVRSGGDLRFAESGDLAALPDAVPADDSAVLFLSGADPALVDVAMGPAWQGALVGGQSDEGCYDSAAAHAVAQRGGPSGRPHDIADWLLARWMPGARRTEPGAGGLSL